MSTQKFYDESKAKVLEYVKGKEGAIPLTDFLKSLWPAPKKDEPMPWKNQGANALIKGILSDLQAEGHIAIEGNQHLRLGENYYPTQDARTHFRGLDTLKIVVEYLG